MSEPDATVGGTFPRTVDLARTAVGIVVGGALAALVWLFVLEEGHTGEIFGSTWTQHDFADGLGAAFGATETARAGLYLTLALGVIVALLFALSERRLPGRGLVKGLSLATILFLVWGLIFTPLVDAREVRLETHDALLPTGFFGMDAGARTVISGLVASILAGLVIARIVPLMRDAAWWAEHPDVGHGLAGEEADAELFELAEQRGEQRVEGTR